MDVYEIHRRTAYLLHEWDSPNGRTNRATYRDDFLTLLDCAHQVFRDNLDMMGKLPDSRSDPIIGLRKIEGLCRQFYKAESQPAKSLETNAAKNNPTPQTMTLLEEFEQNVEIVVGGLTNCIKTIDQQLNIKDLGEDKCETVSSKGRKETFTMMSDLVTGVKKGAAIKVNNAIGQALPLIGCYLSEILLFLTQYIPRFRDNIERQYNDITKQTARIGQISEPIGEIIVLKGSIEKLAEDLRYCVRVAKEADLARTKQNGKKVKSPKAKKKPGYTHSEDYSSVVWFGKTYNFTKTQALCVKHLWSEWEKSEGLSLSEKTIGEKIGSAADNYKLKHTFRVKRNNKSCQHPAWEKMIVSSGKGLFCLKSSRKK